MGLQRIHWVCNELILKGREQNESIAIISNATKTNQKIFIDTLLNCSKKIDKSKIDSPAMLVVGKNVLLSPILNWFQKNDQETAKFFEENKLIEKKYEQYKLI